MTNRNQFRKLPPWAEAALIAALGQRSVRRGIARCLAEEGALLLQFVYRSSRRLATVVQYPVPGIAAAYDKAASDVPSGEVVCYFIVASAPALATADADGVPYMRTMRGPGYEGRSAELLRVPVSLPADRVQTDGT